MFFSWQNDDVSSTPMREQENTLAQLAGTRGEAVKRPLPDDSPVGVETKSETDLSVAISKR